MRKGSLQTQTSEPVIVVDDSDIQDHEGKKSTHSTPEHNSEEELPVVNPYLLSPWRDTRETRKHSLPTPQCSGITASQVRRLSERGEGSGPGPKQTEFLATLSSAPAPVAGGRRHSVVTISKVPSTIFGRNRRESVAAFPSSVFPNRILPSRRESITGPPSTEPRGSVHNLQLDIMDDIVQARKVRMKLWNTSNERVCEVQPLNEAGGVQRYASSSTGRRYSDFVGTTLAPIPSSTKRRASEFPPPTAACTSSDACKQLSSGIVCTNTDLISILSSLTSSAMEINQCEGLQGKLEEKSNGTEQKRRRLKTNRSNSFDISILYENEISGHQEIAQSSLTSANWFIKRHQPISSKTEKIEKKSPRITFSKENFPNKDNKKPKDEINKVLWDERSGSIVDAEVLGNAIEVFLRRSSPESSETANVSTSVSPSKGAVPKTAQNKTSGKSKTSWFSSKSDANDETCDSSLCSTLKDLFVK